MQHFVDAQEWQQAFQHNIAKQSLHQTKVQWRCICCNSAIDIDTDKEITEADLKCTKCNDIQPEPAIAARSLYMLNAKLMQHLNFKYSIQ